MDSGDDTLSIFGTILDTAAPIGTPAGGTPATGMSDSQLASISRLLAANVHGAPDSAATTAGARSSPARQRRTGAARPAPAALSTT